MERMLPATTGCFFSSFPQWYPRASLGLLQPFGRGLSRPSAEDRDFRHLRHRLQHPVWPDRLPVVRPRRLHRYRVLRHGLELQALTMNVVPAVIVVGRCWPGCSPVHRLHKPALRRSGIYFSILTLAFAQMSYALAYSVLGNRDRSPMAKPGLQTPCASADSPDTLAYRWRYPHHRPGLRHPGNRRSDHQPVRSSR
jgi:hypothetical protein